MYFCNLDELNPSHFNTPTNTDKLRGRGDWKKTDERMKEMARQCRDGRRVRVEQTGGKRIRRYAKYG